MILIAVYLLIAGRPFSGRPDKLGYRWILLSFGSRLFDLSPAKQCATESGLLSTGRLSLFNCYAQTTLAVKYITTLTADGTTCP